MFLSGVSNISFDWGADSVGRRGKYKGRRGSRVPVVTTKEEVPGGWLWRYKGGWQTLRVLRKQRVD